MAHMLLEAAFVVVELWLGQVSINRLTLMDVLLELCCVRCLLCAGRMQRLYYWTMELVTDTLF